jgi:hypothetical protein
MKYVLVLLSMLVLAGCGMKDVGIKADPVQPVVIHPPIPDQLQMRGVEWTVFNRAKIEKLLTDYPDQEIVLFALSAKGYENLSLNMAEVIRYLKEQKGVIIYYREEFPSPDATGAEEEE